ncbi:hypothetical protein [Nocardiopsis metallicus]|uniref:dTMP kinase n=1 Tax=Nocardiopsis metallicus TaxID=179819 RepID=A0A840WIG5_9ACTN|nr:hypothetical protein [Nocardiopsis metallicus]MBB5491477.1 dTMP kinase [Nocardiopsis metallicus]
MLLALEGIAGAGKSTVRDRVLAAATAEGHLIAHVGQFSWLSLEATRTIIGLRAGRAATTNSRAAAAVRRDLELHARHNLIPTLSCGSVIADRLTLSTACLLALVHRRPVAHYVRELARAHAPRPQLTVVLTTDPSLCQTRLAQRPTPRRFGEDPTTTAQLAQMFDQAATAWTRETGLAVLRQPCATRTDLDLLVSACLDRLRACAECPSRT